MVRGHGLFRGILHLYKEQNPTPRTKNERQTMSAEIHEPLAQTLQEEETDERLRGISAKTNSEAMGEAEEDEEEDQDEEDEDEEDEDEEDEDEDVEEDEDDDEDDEDVEEERPASKSFSQSRAAMKAER